VYFTAYTIHGLNTSNKLTDNERDALWACSAPATSFAPRIGDQSCCTRQQSDDTGRLAPAGESVCRSTDVYRNRTAITAEARPASMTG